MARSHKFFLFLGVALGVVVSVTYERWWKDTIFDFYFHDRLTDCDSPYQQNPVSIRFLVKNETGEVFRISEVATDQGMYRDLIKLDNCFVIDSKNWTCGGNYDAPVVSDKHSMVKGDLTYTPLFRLGGSGVCQPKIIKR